MATWDTWDQSNYFLTRCMEELFDTFTPDGKPTGLAPRSRVHREGLWHRAVNVFLFQTDGRLLIQRRQLSKDVWPGAWDLSVAEHLRPGETYADGAIRGLREELGVMGVELEPLGGVATSLLDIKQTGIRDYEFQQTFRGVYDGPIQPDTEEVREVKTISLDELCAAFNERPEEFTPWFRQRSADLSLCQ